MTDKPGRCVNDETEKAPPPVLTAAGTALEVGKLLPADANCLPKF